MNNTNQTPLRAAVIGTGYLGRFHAQKYVALPGVDLTAIVDTDGDRAQEVAAELGCAHYTDFRDILDQVDVVSVVTPTSHHYEVSKPLLEAGVHVLVEKPITTSCAEAEDLMAAAARTGAVLQVGHLERFNPAVQTLLETVKQPLFIEGHRLGPFKNRATDVDVVLDLMIHDLDLVLALTNEPIVEIRACGASILTGEVDLANARLEFRSGCTANLTASRVSFADQRKIRVVHANGYVSADCAKRENEILGHSTLQAPLAPSVMKHGAADHLLEELKAFLETVRGHRPVAVTGEEGRKALELALAIKEAMKRPGS